MRVVFARCWLGKTRSGLMVVMWDIEQILSFRTPKWIQNILFGAHEPESVA
jgi:hypothetical protein